MAELEDAIFMLEAGARARTGLLETCYQALLQARKEKALLADWRQRMEAWPHMVLAMSRYTRHDPGCTYDDAEKGDVCICGLRAVRNQVSDADWKETQRRQRERVERARAEEAS